jgi:hypothetical protein
VSIASQSISRRRALAQAHPPSPRDFFHPPDPPIASQSISRRRALWPGEHRLIKWSFQASLLPSRNGTHIVPTAPVEGAPPAICKSELVPRARSGSTETICVSFPPFWCGRWASTRDHRAKSFRPCRYGRRFSPFQTTHAEARLYPSGDGETHCPKIRFQSSLQARLFIPQSNRDQSKRARVSMLLPSWLVSPLDGVVAMLVLLRPWTSPALDLEI